MCTEETEPKLICITGLDGSGKTTHISRLAERLESAGAGPVVPVTIWDLLLDPASRDRIGFDSPRQVDAYLEILHSTARTLFLYHCLYQALELARQRRPRICLINAYWYKYYATEVAHGGQPDRLLDLAAIFPEPDQTVLLRLEPEASFDRKPFLSGYETGFAPRRDRDAFLAFQRRAATALDAIPARSAWPEIDTAGPEDDVARRIAAALEIEPC